MIIACENTFSDANELILHIQSGLYIKRHQPYSAEGLIFDTTTGDAMGRNDAEKRSGEFVAELPK